MKLNKKTKKAVSMISTILILLLAFMAVSTFSKYITQINGQGIGSVAKWHFEVNGSKDNLGTIALRQTASPETLTAGKIAPGTSGSFDIQIDATGNETGVSYKVEFENETNKPTNLKYIYNGATFQSLAELENVLKGEFNANDSNKVKTLTIGWVWDFETGTTPAQVKSNDAIDTHEGELMQNYTFDIVVSGTQLMPM